MEKPLETPVFVFKPGVVGRFAGTSKENSVLSILNVQFSIRLYFWNEHCKNLMALVTLYIISLQYSSYRKSQSAKSPLRPLGPALFRTSKNRKTINIM